MILETTPAVIHPENYRFLQQHVYSHSGIVLEADKHYLFENRLSPIVRSLGLATIDDLCALLIANRDCPAAHQVVEAMTTNETYFFRDLAHYDAIRTELLPRLRQERPDTQRLRFWSAAASTGQEAYSLAMLLLEQGFGGWNIQIVGTDLSTAVLERARSGVYKQIEVNRGLPAPLLIKYFRRCGLDWEIAENVRHMARFDPIDLRKDLRTFGPFDLVFCRNVLIYFDGPTKASIIRSIHGTLFQGGWLLLGGTETAFGLDQWFDRRSIGGATVYVAR